MAHFLGGLLLGFVFAMALMGDIMNSKAEDVNQCVISGGEYHRCYQNMVAVGGKE